jgi:hypothetical protein
MVIKPLVRYAFATALEAVVIAKNKRKRTPKTILRLTELEQSKIGCPIASARPVLNNPRIARSA